MCYYQSLYSAPDLDMVVLHVQDLCFLFSRIFFTTEPRFGRKRVMLSNESEFRAMWVRIQGTQYSHASMTGIRQSRRRVGIQKGPLFVSRDCYLIAGKNKGASFFELTP